MCGKERHFFVGVGDGEVKQEVGVMVQYVEEREKVEGVGFLKRETI